MWYEGEPYGDGNVQIVAYTAFHFQQMIDICRDREFALDDRMGDPEEFFAKLTESQNSMFFGVRAEGKEVGTVYLSGISPSLDAWLNGYGIKQGIYQPIKAVKHLVDWAFRETNVLALHTEHCLLNKAVSALVIRAGFKVDGIMPVSRVHNGTIYDTALFSITKEQWEQSNGRR